MKRLKLINKLNFHIFFIVLVFPSAIFFSFLIFAKAGVAKTNQYKLSFSELYVGALEGLPTEISIQKIGQSKDQPVHFIKLEQSKDQSNHIVGSLIYNNGACKGILNEKSRNEKAKRISFSVKFTHKSLEECVDGVTIKAMNYSKRNKLKINFSWHPEEASSSKISIWMYRFVDPVRKLLAENETKAKGLNKENKNSTPNVATSVGTVTENATPDELSFSKFYIGVWEGRVRNVGNVKINFSLDQSNLLEGTLSYGYKGCEGFLKEKSRDENFKEVTLTVSNSTPSKNDCMSDDQIELSMDYRNDNKSHARLDWSFYGNKGFVSKTRNEVPILSTKKMVANAKSTPEDSSEFIFLKQKNRKHEIEGYWSTRFIDDPWGKRDPRKRIIEIKSDPSTNSTNKFYGEVARSSSKHHTSKGEVGISDLIYESHDRSVTFNQLITFEGHGKTCFPNGEFFKRSGHLSSDGMRLTYTKCKYPFFETFAFKAYCDLMCNNNDYGESNYIRIKSPTPRDAKEIKLFANSEHHQFPDDQFALAKIYALGKGFPKNASKAFEWLYKAADSGHPQAKFHVIELEKSLVAKDKNHLNLDELPFPELFVGLWKGVYKPLGTTAFSQPSDIKILSLSLDNPIKGKIKYNYYGSICQGILAEKSRNEEYQQISFNIAPEHITGSCPHTGPIVMLMDIRDDKTIHAMWDWYLGDKTLESGYVYKLKKDSSRGEKNLELDWYTDAAVQRYKQHKLSEKR